MKISTQFPVAIHILALIAFCKDDMLTSEQLAKSVNESPVAVRRIMARLKKSGMIDVKPGGGGARLKRLPKDISLLDIYRVFFFSNKTEIFDLHQNPDTNCIVGANIHEMLRYPFSEAQKAMEVKLDCFTLKDILMPIAGKDIGV